MPGPHAVVDLEGTAKLLPPGMAEHAPRGDHVSGRVTDPDPAEVQDRAEQAVVNEQVGPQQVGVYPHRISLPRRCLELAVPGCGGRIAVDDAPRRLDRHPRDGVELAEWPAPGARCSDDGIRLSQLDHEPRKLPGCAALIVDELPRIRLALDPAVDRPGAGVLAGWPSPTGSGTCSDRRGASVGIQCHSLSRSAAHFCIRGSRA